jgi:hypothetical protein
MTEQRDMFGGRKGEYIVPSNGTFAHCRSCGAMMIWIQTGNSQAMPLSVATIETRDDIRYALPHFVDCPDAKKWSKKR